MNIKSLRAFIAILDQGSFQTAAGVLNTVQSNVTAHVRKLEEELGCKLIERQGAIRTTADGAELEPVARDILRLHDHAAMRLRSRGRIAGTLRIGSMETTAARRLPPILLSFGRRYPDVRLSLIAGSTGVLEEKLIRREIDCAFMAKSMDGVFDARVVFDEKLLLARPEPCADPFEPENLKAYPLLAFREGCSYRERAERLFRHRGVSPVIHDFGSLDAIVGCLRAGMGQAVLPESYFTGAAMDGHPFHAYPLPRNFGHCPTYLVSSRDAASALVAEFAKVFVDRAEGT
ncbi:LysR family transcriptional regulator [Agaricicola taiwanensis]|uniref:LysR family transcriptional regulator n=1 Tax=Agaricicola taiwanensis TaxID=591372 RepID=A0A8J2YMC3_9RHOB|nr:LysR substrate-binding domain-containing protein [Agaricicola taiwanensis]GGE52009.1 LysR family transcriptional regulator [Agaricicola taiwanensis]